MIRYLEAIEPLSPDIKLPHIKEEIAETVKRSGFESFERATKENFRKVWETIHELAEAQKETHKEVTRLDKALQELAEAQKRTEEELKTLTEEHRKT